MAVTDADGINSKAQGIFHAPAILACICNLHRAASPKRSGYVDRVSRKNGLKADPSFLQVFKSVPILPLEAGNVHPSLSPLSLFSLHPFKLSSRPNGRGIEEEEVGEYVHFLFQNGRSPSTKLSSRATSSFHLIHFLPSLLQPPLRCCHHILWPPKRDL